MNAFFPWSDLITAVVPAAAALSAVWITRNLDDRSRRVSAQQVAYVALSAAAQAALDYHESRSVILPRRYDDNARVESNRRTDELLTALHQAITAVQVVGSPPAIAAAKVIYDAAHGSVSSYLAVNADDGGGWTYMATGAGPVYLQRAINAFVEVTAAETRIGRWRRVKTRRSRMQRLGAEPALKALE